MEHLEKALEHIRKNVNKEFINFCVCKAMEIRYPFSLAYSTLADDIIDLLEEYGEDNDLPEGWWCEYGDLDEIIEQL